MSIVFGLTYLFEVIQSILNRRSKIVGWVLLLFSFVLFVFLNGSVSDNSVYTYYYTHPETPSKFETLFVFLMQGSHFIGLPYFGFKAILFVIEFLLLWYGAKNFGIKNIGLFFVLVLTLQFFEASVQLRNYLMATMVFYGVSVLFKGEKNAELKYLAIILMATFVQFLAMFFILLLPIRKLSIKTALYFIGGMIVLLSFLTMTSLGQEWLITLTDAVFSRLGSFGPKVMQYVERMRPGKILLADVMLTGVYWMFFWRIEKSGWENKFTDFGMRISLLLFLAIPLYFVAYNFDRILIDLSLIIFILAIGSVENMDISNSRKYQINALLFFAVLIYAIASYSYGIKFGSTLRPMFTDNDLLRLVGVMF